MNKIKILSVIFFLSISFALFSADDEKSGPVLSFEKERQDYGTIYLDTLSPGTTFNIDVKFSNTGDAPILLSNVRACCGTRVLDWPQDPIMPNDEGTIKVSFRLAQRAQRISRTVTINYNNEQKPTEVFRIVGEVVEGRPEGSEFIQGN